MKIAITGHTKGIGKAIANLYPDYIGFSRSNDFDIGNPDCVNRIVELSKNCDIFVNNAYHGTTQTTIFERF